MSPLPRGIRHFNAFHLIADINGIHHPAQGELHPDLIFLMVSIKFGKSQFGDVIWGKR